MKRIPENTPRQAKAAARSSWSAMRRRCEDPKYHAAHRYSGRGITYPIEWKEFKQFFIDLGPPPFDWELGRFYTLDRKDRNESYSKLNCRWLSASMQQRDNPTRTLLRLGFMD